MQDDPEIPDRHRKVDRDARKLSAPRHSLWRFIVFAAMLLLLVPVLWSSESGRSVSYSEFKALLTAHKVDNLVIGDDRITGVLTVEGIGSALSRERADALRKAAGSSPRYPFHTVRVEDPKLLEELHAAGVEYAGRVESGWITSMLTWLGPLLLLFLFWTMMLRRAGAASGVMAIGKSQAKIYMERSTGVTFNDVAGIDEARSELMEIVDFLKNPERYRRLGGKIPKGVLLLGAPGTGKTLLAKALAGEARVPFFSLSGSDFVELFVGVGAARVRDLFVQAQEHAPSIIFIDELDALGRSRSVASLVGGHEEREQTLNQLLAEMDGFDTQKGVIILAATNRPEILDPALMRPGRFDRKVVLDRPDAKGREQILRVHTRSVILAPDVDLAALAARTPGFVGADLANLVNEAALAAARGEKGAVEAVDFENAIDRVMAGLERKSRLISPKERVIVAHHEAGHALVAERRSNADRVARVSIIPRGIAALGYTRQQPSEDRFLLTRSELLDRLDVLLGGRVAEEIVFGDVSTGAHDDLQHATDLARDMVARFGMSDLIGLAAYEPPKQPIYVDATIGRAFEYSEETARLIDAEVRQLLNAAQERVRTTLTGERAALERVAKLLMEREVIDRATLLEAIAQRPAIVAA